MQNILTGHGRQNKPPLKGVSILILGTYEYMQKGLEDVIKLRILRWGEEPGLSRWACCNHRVVRKSGMDMRRVQCDKVLAGHGWL